MLHLFVDVKDFILVSVKIRCYCYGHKSQDQLPSLHGMTFAYFISVDWKELRERLYKNINDIGLVRRQCIEIVRDL